MQIGPLFPLAPEMTPEGSGVQGEKAANGEALSGTANAAAVEEAAARSTARVN